MKDLLKNFRAFVGDDLIYQIIISVIIIIVSYGLARLISYIGKMLIRPIVKKTETQFDDKILEVVRKGLSRLLFVGGIYFALSMFRQGFGLVSNYSKRKLIEEYPYLYQIADYLEIALYLILAITVLITIFQVISLAFDWYAESIKAEENNNLYGSIFPLFRKLSKLLITALAVVIILAKLGVDISAFVVSLGVGSLAVALAAQETLSNMISGLIIMADRPFRIGDRIRIGTEINGDVIEIGIRSTKVLDFDRNILVIPNNDIVKSRIVNFTYPDPYTRVLVEFGVVYGTDVNSLRSTILELIKDEPHIATEPKPEVVFLRFEDSSILMRLDVKTPDYRHAFDLGCNLREKIYNELNERGFSFAFPTRTVYIKKEPE
ncbi:MAG: mechanosensitive ion channel family protein [Ignavibacteriaceae bacterium]|nr:mechanosensitive ion channel family protein [Ignavibacteriaceae bacterium]